MKKFKSSLFLNLFIKISAILTAFVLVIIFASSTLLYDFYCLKEKNKLIAASEQFININVSDIKETNAAIKSILDENNFEIEIYDASGSVYYTTESGKMMDYMLQDRKNFSMVHSQLKVIDSTEIDTVTYFQTAVDAHSGNEYLAVVKLLEGNYFAELKIQKDILSNNAAITGEFTVIVAVIFLIVSLIWAFFTAKGTAKPISEMNKITKNMAALNFTERLSITSNDEIGELASSVNNMADSLSYALDNLQKANEKLKNDIELERKLDIMRKEFVANVSHELKTPISIISGYAEGLKLNINSADKNLYCDTIIDEATRMNRLVLSILELSKYESGQMPIKREIFDVSPVMATLCNRIFANSNITVINTLPENLKINADISGTEQVIKAYLENALAHTPAGGTVKIYLHEENGFTKIAVFNTGSHIEPEKLENIWQSFYRGDTSHKRDSNRFGLGLSIVAAIMKMHNLPYGVFNTQNGVCFWFGIEKADNI